MAFNIKFPLLLSLLSLLFFSCEDTISPELAPAEEMLVVDAWLNNKPEDQTIRLTWSQPYLQNTIPPGVSGATVLLSYDGGEITFTEDAAEPGLYRWTATPATTEEVFGQIGRNYKLTITAAGETYEATSQIRRIMPIDSIAFTFEEDDPRFPENSYSGEVYARDLSGIGDGVWIKTYKNGTFLSKPSEIKLAYDAGFSPSNTSFDGITFIPPIRSINVDETDENDEPLPPFLPGDSASVELHSITLEAYTFLNEMVRQTNRPGGFGELFAEPLGNVSTNIKNINPSRKKALGFFNVAAVSVAGRKLVP